MQGLQDMSELIRERKVGKYYCCLVHGDVGPGAKIKGLSCQDEKEEEYGSCYSGKSAGSDFIGNPL